MELFIGRRKPIVWLPSGREVSTPVLRSAKRSATGPEADGTSVSLARARGVQPPPIEAKDKGERIKDKSANKSASFLIYEFPFLVERGMIIANY